MFALATQILQCIVSVGGHVNEDFGQIVFKSFAHETHVSRIVFDNQNVA